MLTSTIYILPPLLLLWIVTILTGCGSHHQSTPSHSEDPTLLNKRISASSTGLLYLEDIDSCAALEGLSSEYDIPGRSDITERWSSGKDLMRCISQLKISRFDALFTLHNLRYGVAEAYAFTDIARDSNKSIESNTCGFKTYDIKVDLLGILDRRIEEISRVSRGMSDGRRMDYLKGGMPALDFHGSLMDLLNTLYDAHTYYQSPLTMFTFVIPVGFRASCSPCDGMNKNQKVYLREVGLDVEYRKVFGRWPTLQHYNYLTPIATINGYNVLDWMESMVKGVLKGVHLGLNQRLNDWFFVKDGPIYVPLAWYHVGSSDIKPLKVVYEDGASDSIEWMGKFIDHSKGMSSMGVTDGLSWRVYNSLVNKNDKFDYVVDMEKDKFGKDLDTLLEIGNITTGDPTLDRAVIEVLNKNRRQVTAVEQINTMDDRTVTSALAGMDMRRPHTTTSNTHQLVRGGATVVDKEVIWKEALGGILKWRVEGRRAMVVVVTTFSIDATKYHHLLPQFFTIQQEARALGIRRILLDLSGNTGGSLSSAFALLWYLLEPSEVCQPLSKHITEHWSLWLASFADHWAQSIEEGFRGAWREGDEFIRGRMEELRSILRYAAAIDSGVSIPNLDAALKNVDGIERWLLGMEPDGASRKWAFKEILKHKLFLTERIFQDVTRSNTGWYPFGNVDFVDPATGTPFEPPLEHYDHPETHQWGGVSSSNYSQRAPWAFCMDIVQRQMPALKEEQYDDEYSWSYWEEVGVLTDGRCGSACTTVASTLYISTRATTYTFGGRIDKPMAFGSYAGGNVISYDQFWPRFSIASHLGNWGTLGGSQWSKKYAHKWMHYATIFPTTATASFTFNMAFHNGLGPHSLPVQWYEIPSHHHVGMWARSLNERVAIEKYVVHRDWAYDMLHPQYPTMGYCIPNKKGGR